MDDHSYYHHHPHDTESIDGDGDESTIAGLQTEKFDEEEEVRDGILDFRDTESGTSNMERLKSSKSVKDPHLVRVIPLSSLPPQYLLSPLILLI